MSKAKSLLSKADVLHLAKLARLELSPEEVKNYSHQLDEVLSYVAKLQELPVSAAPGRRTSTAKLRPDQVRVWPEADLLIKQAPQTKNGLISVPPVFSDK